MKIKFLLGSRGIYFFLVLFILPVLSFAKQDLRIHNYDVQHYDLAISFNVQAKKFTGRVVMSADALTQEDSIVISASNHTLTIDSVFFNGKKTAFLHYDDFLVVKPSSSLGKGRSFEIAVFYNGVSRYNGEYESGGVYITKDRGVDKIATSSEPDYAKTWWPCKDVPNDKATIGITVTVPQPLTAVSNGILNNIVYGDSTTTFEWETSYPTSTYLVAISASIYRHFFDTYEGLNGQKMKISYYVYPEHFMGARKDFLNVSEILKFFAKNYGEYPFINEKLGLVEVPGNITIEHQTIISLSDNLMTGDQQHELTFVHEIAHHWWGNLITTMDWKNTWLNEGFATYAEALWLEHSKGFAAYQQYMNDLMGVKMGLYAGSVYGRSDTVFSDSFSPRVYRKGAIVLHMLRGIVGDSAFHQIMYNYTNNEKYFYGNVTTEDFANECEKVYGKTLKWFFDEWVYAHTENIDRPEYEYSWTDSETGSGYQVELMIKQSSFRQQLYQMPISVSVSASSSNNVFHYKIENTLPVEVFTFMTPDKPRWLDLDKDNWIFKIIRRKD